MYFELKCVNLRGKKPQRKTLLLFSVHRKPHTRGISCSVWDQNTKVFFCTYYYYLHCVLRSNSTLLKTWMGIVCRLQACIPCEYQWLVVRGGAVGAPPHPSSPAAIDYKDGGWGGGGGGLFNSLKFWQKMHQIPQFLTFTTCRPARIQGETLVWCCWLAPFLFVYCCE